MDNIDKKILSNIQKGLKLESKPYLTLANDIGITEEDAIERIKKLKDLGYIRRIGGIFNSKKLGYFSTLCAAHVPINKTESVSSIINKYMEVTHNYIRDDYYNMWFTIIANSNEKIENIILNIKKEAKIEELINLPAKKLFKIKATFNINIGGEKFD